RLRLALDQLFEQIAGHVVDAHGRRIRLPHRLSSLGEADETAREPTASGGGGALTFLLSVLLEGVLAGAAYALIALAFVVLYKSSRMVNFAAGEWVMAGALLAGAGYHALGIGAAGALCFAAAAMAWFGIVFNALVVRRVVLGPVIIAIMVTLGL